MILPLETPYQAAEPLMSVVALLLLTLFPVTARAATLGDPPSACDLLNRFDTMHTVVTDLTREVEKVDASVRHLHASSRSRPYTRIEGEGREIRLHTKLALNALSDIVIALDTLPNTRGKSAALSLTAAYWNAIELLADYASTVVLYEREENLVSMNVNGRPYFTFGVNKGAPQVAGDNYAMDQLEEKVDEPREAVRMQELPESRYGHLCDWDMRRKQSR
jgi:hypothetical protein